MSISLLYTRADIFQHAGFLLVPRVSCGTPTASRQPSAWWSSCESFYFYDTEVACTGLCHLTWSLCPLPAWSSAMLWLYELVGWEKPTHTNHSEVAFLTVPEAGVQGQAVSRARLSGPFQLDFCIARLPAAWLQSLRSPSLPCGCPCISSC